MTAGLTEQSVDTDDVVVYVSSLDELFAAPPFDPWSGQGATEAGVDRLVDRARAAPRGSSGSNC